MRADKAIAWMLVDVIATGAIAITLAYYGFGNVAWGVLVVGSVGIMALWSMGLQGEGCEE